MLEAPIVVVIRPISLFPGLQKPGFNWVLSTYTRVGTEPWERKSDKAYGNLDDCRAAAINYQKERKGYCTFLNYVPGKTVEISFYNNTYKFNLFNDEKTERKLLRFFSQVQCVVTQSADNIMLSLPNDQQTGTNLLESLEEKGFTIHNWAAL
jgi:hypothetical protein